MRTGSQKHVGSINQVRAIPKGGAGCIRQTQASIGSKGSEANKVKAA
jgi:hypothetical protein